MTRFEVADLLEGFALDVEHIRGVSHRRPEAFAEDKSEVVGRMRAKAKEMRTIPTTAKPLPVLHPCIIQVDRREVRVEIRGRRA